MKTTLILFFLSSLASCSSLQGNLALLNYVGSEDGSRTPAQMKSTKPLRILVRAEDNKKPQHFWYIDRGVCGEEAALMNKPLDEQKELYLTCMNGRGWKTKVVDQEEYDAAMNGAK